jgi:hypothetical protein
MVVDNGIEISGIRFQDQKKELESNNNQIVIEQ